MSDPEPTDAGEAAWERFLAGLDPQQLERERFRAPDPSEEFHSIESRRERERHATVVALLASFRAGEISLAELRAAIADADHPHHHHHHHGGTP